MNFYAICSALPKEKDSTSSVFFKIVKTSVTNISPSLQTFALYGQRLGGIEPHFKDYKSAAFELPRSRVRDVAALNRLLMLLAAATLIAIVVAVQVCAQGQRHSVD